MHVSSLIVEERVVLFRDLVPEVGAKFPWGEQVTNFQPLAQIVHLFMYFRASLPQYKLTTATLQQNFRCVLRNNSFDEVVFNNIQRRASC